MEYSVGKIFRLDRLALLRQLHQSLQLDLLGLMAHFLQLFLAVRVVRSLRGVLLVPVVQPVPQVPVLLVLYCWHRPYLEVLFLASHRQCHLYLETPEDLPSRECHPSHFCLVVLFHLLGPVTLLYLSVLRGPLGLVLHFRPLAPADLRDRP